VSNAAKMATNMIIGVAAVFLYFVVLSSARKFPDLADALTHLQSLNNHNWSAMEWAWSASYDRQWLQNLQSIVENNTFQQFSTSTYNISTQCQMDLRDWLISLTRLEPWAIQSQCSSQFLPESELTEKEQGGFRAAGSGALGYGLK